MNQSSAEYLTAVLRKVARRYEQNGRLGGVMKVGTSLGNDKLKILHNFFGIDPVRTNSRDEVRIDFGIALANAPESKWLESISSHLGYSLEPAEKKEHSEAVRTLISRLQLAFPHLETLTSRLQDSPDDISRMLKNGSQQEATALCFQAAETVGFLLRNDTPVTISEIGARFFGDSKKLRQGELRSLLLRWLSGYCADVDPAEQEEQIWTTFHVYHDRLTVIAVIYGPIVYRKNGIEFDWIAKLHEQGEAATISWANLKGIEKIYWKGRRDTPPNIFCCENESPYSQLIRQKPDECHLFTNGFPGSAVRKIYKLLAPQATSCFHWGDTDPNGLRIASILNSIYPLQLFRCDTATLRQHEKHLIPLSQKQKQTAETILHTDSKFAFGDELAFTLEKGWLEQESWRPEAAASVPCGE